MKTKLETMKDVLLHQGPKANLYKLYHFKDQSKNRYQKIIRQTVDIENIAICIESVPQPDPDFPHSGLYRFDSKANLFKSLTTSTPVSAGAEPFPKEMSFDEFMTLIKSSNFCVAGVSRFRFTYGGNFFKLLD